MKIRKFMALVLGLLIITASAGYATGQDLSNKPIRIIVPYAPGGSHDLMARAIQVPMGKALGTTVIVENMPGGSTKVGSMEALKAKADGHTLLLMNNVSWVGYYYSKTYDFKPWEKATPLGIMATSPFAFIQIRADAPYRTWSQLVEHAKKNPGQLTCSGPGAGGMMELLFTKITQAAGIKCRYVPFAGASPAQTALLGGHVDFQICTVGEAIAMLRAGKTRGVAITSDKKYASVPDVPTFKELGLGESVWIQYPLWGPPNMPKDVVGKIAKAIEAAVNDPDFVKLATDKFACIPKYRSGSDLKEETDKFDKGWGSALAAAYK